MNIFRRKQIKNQKTYYFDWIFPLLRNPPRWWYLGSAIATSSVGLFSKIILVWLTNTKVYNKKILTDAIGKRPKGVPLLTISNHYSCFDDPGVWGTLPLNQVCGQNTTRWSLAAHDVCFTNKFHSFICMLGKVIPVVRGSGVYQPAIDICIQKLINGDWLHIFPEGKVNLNKEHLRLKWGVGRILYECPVLPIIIPIWHEGMDSVLPNKYPHLLKFGGRVTIKIGKPIEIKNMIEDLRSHNSTDVEARKILTDKIEEELKTLRRETELIHKKA